MGMVHQGAGASLGVVGDGEGDGEAVGEAGDGVADGDPVRGGVRDGVPLGRPLVGGTVREGVGEGAADVALVEGAAGGVVEEEGATGCRGGVTRVGDGEGEGVGLADGVGGGFHSSSTGSTNGMIVSGRTGPPAKLTPTIAV
ncbi:GTPase [Micromonospora sp. NPDC000207]|uniref:GTPase n=1 Tax=Micromonospora sp. NPDC000207 TaxID=3154246 RepID=UPI0033190AFE